MFGKQVLRSIHTSAPRLSEATQAAAAAANQVAAAPARPPVRRVGALRGGFTGFLLGVSLTGAGAYYYLLDEYNAGQQAILADVITLRASLRELNEQVNALKKDTK